MAERASQLGLRRSLRHFHLPSHNPARLQRRQPLQQPPVRLPLPSRSAPSTTSSPPPSRSVDRYPPPPRARRLPPNDATSKDNLIYSLCLLGCVYKITRGRPSFSYCIGSPSSPRYCDAEAFFATEAPSNELMVYTTQGYSHFLLGNDDAVEALDKENAAKYWMKLEHAFAAVRAMEEN
nr:unnamed protein product [Digitaria exilis]